MAPCAAGPISASSGPDLRIAVSVISTRYGLAPIGAAWLAGFILAAGHAHAQTGTIFVSYQADATCPPAEVFLAAVRAKTPNVALAPVGAPVPYIVAVSTGAGQSVARLTMHGADSTTTMRDLAGASCEEVVRALALTTSLAITHDIEHPPPTPAACPPPPPAPPPPPTDSPPRERPRMFAGMGASLLGGIAPHATFAGSVFMQGDLPASTWPASLRLGVLYANPTTTTDSAWGTADFQAMLAGVDVCPYRIDMDPRFRLLPSVRVEGGTYRASGNVTAPGGQPRTFSGTFASLGPLVRGQVLIGNLVLLEAEIGLRFPLSRHSFEIDPAPGNAAQSAKPVYDVPVVAGFGGVGLGIQFF
jgi:hypothetical protein